MCHAAHGQYPTVSPWPDCPLIPPPPVLEAAAEPLCDLRDFEKQFRQHGVPVSTSRTDAPWVAELHCEVGAPVIKLIKYELTSAAPETLDTCGALSRPGAGRGFGVSLRVCCC